jgi:hypothetical protein
MLVRAIETAFLAFSVPAVEFVPVPKAWRKSNPDGSAKGPSSAAKAYMKLALIERDGFQCAYCAREFVDLDDATLDHVIPNSVVGHWQPWNLLLSCGPCNNAKGDSIPLVLLPMLAHVLVRLAQSAEFRVKPRRKRKTTPAVPTPPIPTNGFPSRSAYRRAMKGRARTQAVGQKVSQAVQTMTGRPVRLALEAAPVRLSLPCGQSEA